MFCDSNYIYEPASLGCEKRWLPEIITIISLFFSVFVVTVTIKKVRLNLLNKLILQIIFSEILDGINILLCILNDAQGKPLFENYTSRRFVCFTQIYLGVFTCLWTLTASLFISLRMYDLMIKRYKPFQNFLKKYATILSVAIPSLISYIFWTLQVTAQANKLIDLDENGFYAPSGVKRTHFKYIYCWIDETLNFILLGIVFLLIVMNIYYSIFIGSRYITNITNSFKGSSEERRPSIRNQLDKVDHIKYTLWIYPLSSCIIWGFFFIFQVICDVFHDLHSGPFVWFYIILISVRQPIYTCIFCYTQRKIKDCCIDTLLCKNCKSKNEKSRDPSFGQVKNNSPVLPEENLIA